MSTIMPAFVTFPKEGEIIGRLLAGYGELELGLCLCVATARNDFDMVFKAMFRPRGETQRIDIADAMGRSPYAAANLETQFAEVVSATRYCLRIRNQFAHCYWSDNFGKGLCFVDVEDVADSNKPVTDLFSIPAQDLSLALLREQEAFFLHTRACLDFLYHELRVRAGLSSTQPLAAPKKVTRPPRYSP